MMTVYRTTCVPRRGRDIGAHVLAQRNAELPRRFLRDRAARLLGVQLHVLHAGMEKDFDTVFASLLGLRVGGLVIGTDSFFNTRKEQIAELSLRHRVPTIHQYREFVKAGGLMGDGTDTSDLSRQVGVYTGRILKGDNPADMPVQQATKVELSINLKTAKMLALPFRCRSSHALNM
jgi:putative tryptophan/tyrosine transport system substrate-binding protein